MPVELTPEQQTAIDADILGGHKLQAIKKYREATGAGLAEAKTAVEARERELHHDRPASPEQVSSDVDAELLAGRKIQAIKLYRQATGAGLAEAKRAVEQREAALKGRHPELAAQRAKGCMGVILIAISIVGSVLAGWLAV